MGTIDQDQHSLGPQSKMKNVDAQPQDKEEENCCHAAELN